MRAEAPSRITARQLLAEAARIYDAPGAPFARAARTAWRSGFASAAEWMELALETVRSARGDGPRACARPRGLNALGFLKNGGSVLAAAALGGATLAATGATFGPLAGCAAGAVSFVLAFYAIEGQMVFLFPILLDGRHDDDSWSSVIAACRAWTVRAGGTLSVMRVVMPISARMMFGGLFGHGFLRSWCLGCLAVVIWYDALDSAPEHARDIVEATA